MPTPIDQPPRDCAAHSCANPKNVSEANPQINSWHRFMICLLCGNIFVGCISREIADERPFGQEQKPRWRNNIEQSALNNAPGRVLSYRPSEHYSTPRDSA